MSAKILEKLTAFHYAIQNALGESAPVQEIVLSPKIFDLVVYSELGAMQLYDCKQGDVYKSVDQFTYRGMSVKKGKIQDSLGDLAL